MAADVTLVALPNTPGNWRLARVVTFETPLLTDEVWRDDDGCITLTSSGDAHWRWRELLHERMEWLEVGPISYLKAGLLGSDAYIPGPTHAVHQRWAYPQLVTPLLVTCTLIDMNVPDRSVYRRSRERAHGHRVGRRSWSRTTTRRDVKRWLTAHVGWICFAEVW